MTKQEVETLEEERVRPFYEDSWLSVWQGDCREVMRSLPEELVHCVVTSPPYWGLRDYGVGGQLGLEATPEEYVANRNYPLRVERLGSFERDRLAGVEP